MREILKAIRDYTVKNKKITAAILLAICGIMLTYYVVKVATIPDIQWDLKMYQSTVKVFFEGRNYYDFELLKEKGSPLPFVYSPYAIYLLLFLGVGSFQKIALLWLGIKVGFLIVLFFIWKKIFYEYFDKQNSLAFFCLFLVWSLRAFNRAIYADLYAGNISIIEEFLIWTGMFFLLLRRRYLIFGLYLLIASFFKVLPIFLIGLVLVVGTGNIKDRIKKLGIIALISLVVWGAGLLIMPNEFAEWSGFLKLISFMPSEAGKVNPAILPFIREIIGNGGRALELTLYFLWVFTVFIVSFIVSKHISKTDFSSERKEKYLFFLWCLVFPIIMPRFKDYTFIFLLPIFYYSLYEIIKESKKWPLKAVAFLLLAFSFFVMEKENVGIIFIDYWPLLITITSWIVFAFLIMKDSIRLEGKKISKLNELAEKRS